MKSAEPQRDAPSESALYDRRYAGDYREHLSGFEIARWEALRHFITRLLKLGPARAVLDYGAGSGLHVGLWEAVFPEARLQFCDISAAALEKFKAKYPRHADRYHLLREGRPVCGDAQFDVVVSVEVMEHVDDLNSYLRDVYRLLKPGGWFVWTTPCANRLSIEHLLGALSGRIDPTSEGYRRWSWEDPTHLRRLRSGEVEALLRQRGFAEVRFRFRSHLFSFLCTYAPTRLAQRLRDRLMTLDYTLFRLLPNGASMIGAARKPVDNRNPDSYS